MAWVTVMFRARLRRAEAAGLQGSVWGALHSECFPWAVLGWDAAPVLGGGACERPGPSPLLPPLHSGSPPTSAPERPPSALSPRQSRGGQQAHGGLPTGPGAPGTTVQGSRPGGQVLLRRACTPSCCYSAMPPPAGCARAGCPGWGCVHLGLGLCALTLPPCPSGQLLFPRRSDPSGV